MRLQHAFLALSAAAGLLVAPTLAQNTSQLSEQGWYSDDTRADGQGPNPTGTDLVSPTLTDDPEASASGNPAHDPDIRRQIQFGPAPAGVPRGKHRGAVHLRIGPSGAGMSQISHRKDDGVGHATGAAAFGSGMTMSFTWMADGTTTVTPKVAFGVKTSEFPLAPTSSRTGQNAWDKLVIYEPSKNGQSADGLWHTESVNFNTGNWWVFDRVSGASSAGNPMTLAAMSTSSVILTGTTTLQDVYNLLTATGAHVTSVIIGIGPAAANGSAYVSQLKTNFYRAGSVTTFGQQAALCDQDVTNEVIIASPVGGSNGAFTVDRFEGMEVGLRAKLRFDATNQPADVFNSNGDGTYTFAPGSPTGSGLPAYATANTPFWSIQFSVNTDYDGSSLKNLDQFTYELGMDFDPGPGVNYLAFDPISSGSQVPFDPPITVNVWQNYIGNNLTPANGGTVTTNTSTYLSLLAGNNIAQKEWNVDELNLNPFNTFDPNVPGRYEFYLAAFDGTVELARTHITVIVEAPKEYDQNVTSNAIFGSGVLNGAFTTRRFQGVELGLRSKVRFDASNNEVNVFNSNGDGTYTMQAGAPTGAGLPPWATTTTPRWNIEWSANVNHDGSSGLVLDGLTYEFGMDFDPSAFTNFLVFDPISPNSVIPFTAPITQTFWDHAIGTNATAQGAGTVATTLAQYTALLAANNLAQNSWNLEDWNEAPFNGFVPASAGRYDFYLAAIDGNGDEVARTDMSVLVRDGSSLSVEAEGWQRDQSCNTPGVQVKYEVWARNLTTGVQGYQIFLAFDPSQLSFEPTLSSYTATPFNTHIQPMATANVAPGELRLDGTVPIGSTNTVSDDTLLATLYFTVAAECDPVQVSFDLTQPFPSELTAGGVPVPTSLVDSSAIIPDNTPPMLTPLPDILVATDASSGCGSAVVVFASPAATDTCGDVTVECFPPSGTAFPSGQTTKVTCLATDTAGNRSTTTFDVTVTSTNVLFLDIQLAGVNTATTRCIRFVPDDCSAAVDIPIPFDATGFFSGSIEVPCGNWTSLCAKDEQHTKWSTVTLSLSGDGVTYVADATLQLTGGDTDNDGDVDINDVTYFISTFGQLAQDGGCPWDDVTRDADFDNNGAVGVSDYGFLTSNWLTTSSCGCSGTLPLGNDQDPGRVSKPVDNDRDRSADLDNNGRIDWRDVRLFEIRRGLPHQLSERMQTLTPRRPR